MTLQFAKRELTSTEKSRLNALARLAVMDGQEHESIYSAWQTGFLTDWMANRAYELAGELVPLSITTTPLGARLEQIDLVTVTEASVTVGEQGNVENAETKVTKRILTTDKGMVVETTLTDAEAAEQCNQSGNTFGQNLVAKYVQYGKLSTSQWAWVHKIALDHIAKHNDPQQQPGAPAPAGKYNLIVKLFENSKGRLKYPKIVFRLENGNEVSISLCGERSKYPGDLHVNGSKTGYTGRIKKDGSWFERANYPEVLKLLDEMAIDPVGFAAAYGKKTGRCCFCHTQLTDPQSIAAGFGPTCSRNYGLDVEYKKASL